MIPKSTASTSVDDLVNLGLVERKSSLTSENIK
ncbi:helix-turn-helix domain-containing protein [Clostridium sp. LS]|nr:helix-turn-helix domain-containing protein [Clostridium sp. LS]